MISQNPQLLRSVSRAPTAACDTRALRRNKSRCEVDAFDVPPGRRPDSHGRLGSGAQPDRLILLTTGVHAISAEGRGRSPLAEAVGAIVAVDDPVQAQPVDGGAFARPAAGRALPRDRRAGGHVPSTAECPAWLRAGSDATTPQPHRCDPARPAASPDCGARDNHRLPRNACTRSLPVPDHAGGPSLLPGIVRPGSSTSRGPPRQPAETATMPPRDRAECLVP